MVKIGLEVHQRLATNKLFCNCSSDIVENAPTEQIIHRRLHPVLSELGETDRTSLAEQAKERSFNYQICPNNCLVELDEEPPKNMNSEALKIALQICFELNATPVDEVHHMRKTVIDGSNTSGFQRTSIIAVSGHIDSSKGVVKIPQIAIEEESAGIVNAPDHSGTNSNTSATYRLDRLGIPLIEITTDPDIKDGEHLVEVAEKIGMILRATGKVARGLGTIRQDVNISTDGGARVEIKGAQDLKLLPLLVQNEERRQTELLTILLHLRTRKALPVEKQAVDLTRIFTNTKSSLIEKGLHSGSVVLGAKLPLHGELLGTEIQPGRRYGTELSDYAKLAGVKGIIHSDEKMDKYSISDAELAQIRVALKLTDSKDAFVLVVAPKDQAEKALSFVIDRANMDFVPAETRKANADGTSSFMRPLSGRARLYPETDVPPLEITEQLLKEVESGKGDSLDAKKQKLEKLLNKEFAVAILKSRHLHLFEKLVATGSDPTLVATTIENTIISLRREGVEFSDLEKTLTELFLEYKKASFVKAAIPEVLKGMAKGARMDAVLKVYRLARISGVQLEKLAEENKFNMPQIMQKYRLQVDAGELAEVLNKKKAEDEKEHTEYR
ncbi:Glu-tRNA(Gln) amidotransferase subunit GatE [Candidatus Micrarchaeota archaeon]|nr:Glu-tRNA(Gln) amidotransferase subunit GatE [Candidatus Micrarchaeota archaeon]